MNYYEHPDKFNEFLDYQLLFADDFFWKFRYDYLSILQDFSDGKIEAKVFIQEFQSLYSHNMTEVSSQLEYMLNQGQIRDVTMDQRSENFFDIVAQISFLNRFLNTPLELDNGLKYTNVNGLPYPKPYTNSKGILDEESLRRYIRDFFVNKIFKNI